MNLQNREEKGKWEDNCLHHRVITYLVRYFLKDFGAVITCDRVQSRGHLRGHDQNDHHRLCGHDRLGHFHRG